MFAIGMLDVLHAPNLDTCITLSSPLQMFPNLLQRAFSDDVDPDAHFSDVLGADLYSTLLMTVDLQFFISQIWISSRNNILLRFFFFS